MVEGTKIPTRATCVVCVLEDVYTAADIIALNEKDKSTLRREAVAMLNKELSGEHVPSFYITEAHRILKKVSRKNDPFEKQRRICNDAGIEVAKQVDSQLKSIKGEYDRFKFLAKWAITGNLIDIRTVGTSYELTGSGLRDQLFKVFQEELAVDDLKEIYSSIKNSKRILYVLDNVGEIALDCLFLRELKTYGINLTVAARGGPMTSDATLEDLSYVGFGDVADKTITTGSDTLGVILSEASEDFLEEAKKADIVIGKGQANFYTFSTFRSRFPGKVVSLFRTKCECISSVFGKKGKIGIATLVKETK